MKSVPAASQNNPFPGWLRDPVTYLCFLFLIGGMLASFGDLLNPFFKTYFNLNYTRAALVQFSHYAAGPVFSLVVGWMMGAVGFRRPMLIGMWLFLAGCAVMVLSGQLGFFWLFLLGIFSCAAGSSWVLTPSNPYATLTGKPEHAASRLSLINAFYALGATLGPVLLSNWVLNSDNKGSSAVALPYLLVGSMMAVALVLFYVRPLPEPVHQNSSPPATAHFRPWQRRQVWMTMIALFMYVGVEVCIPANLVSFLTQPSVAALSPEAAGRWISAYWGLFMIGRFLGAPLMRVVRPTLLLPVFTIGSFVSLGLALLIGGETAMWLMLTTGFWHSVLFPNLIALGVRRLGRDTGPATGWLFVATVGGSLLPFFQGVAADFIGLSGSYGVPMVAYCIILLISRKLGGTRSLMLETEGT